MKTFILALGLLVSCTKANPNVCCTDAANCAVQGLDSTKMCTGGLVCRGNECVAETCSSSAECEAGAPYCPANGLCAPTCDSDSECPGFGHDPTEVYCSMGACVECRTSSDCSAAAPVCDVGACRTCKLDSECASGVCADDGTCVATSNVIYIDVTGTDAGTCTQGAPCRGLAYAATKGTPSRYRIAAAQGLYEGPFQIMKSLTAANQFDIHGNGSTFSEPAGNDGAVILFEPGFEMITFRDATFTLEGTGKAFVAQSPLSLVSVTATNAGICVEADSGIVGINLHFNNCGTALFSQGQTTIDGMEASGGTMGLQTSQASLTIKNLLIHDTTGLAAEFATTMGTISFATIADCGAPAGTGARAVQCDSNGVSIFSSILWAPGSTQQPAVAGCSLANTIAGPMAISGALNSDPAFVSSASQNYRLSGGSPAIDLVNTGPTSDIEGTTRPQGVRFDLGAYEFKP